MSNIRQPDFAGRCLHPPRPRNGEEGSVLVLVAVSLVILLAMVGLALDVGQMFIAKQQAQAAADAAAQAGIMDMYRTTNSTGGQTYGSHYKCVDSSTTPDPWTPCTYAWRNGFGTSTADSVTIDFPASAPASGVACSTGSSTRNICVTVSRQLTTTLMRVLTSTQPTVTATAAAAISPGTAPVPIVITHPTLKDALLVQGGSSIVIAGGGSTTTIEVNSSGASGGPEAFAINSFIDMSGAGPNGTGGQFESVGPANSAVTVTHTATCARANGDLCVGTTGSYVTGVSAVPDPLGGLTQPTSTGLSAGTVSAAIANGVSLGVTGCSAKCADTHHGCLIYTPGTYASGISVANNTAYLYPGLYYITGASANTSFGAGANGNIFLLSSVCPNVRNPASNDFRQGGVVVFNHAAGGQFSLSSSSADVVLTGADQTSSLYEGIVFWEDRTLTAGVSHQLSGGGVLDLTGTIYINMQSSGVTNSNYQEMEFQGGSCSNTQLVGQIVTNVLLVSGGSCITMTLTPAAIGAGSTVALVQ